MPARSFGLGLRRPIRRESVLHRVLYDSLAYGVGGGSEQRKAGVATAVRGLLAGEIHAGEYLLSLDLGIRRTRVYFVRLEIPGKAALRPVKIGVTINLPGRLATIRTTAPYAISVLAIAPSALLCEPILHAEFREDHLRGEWFKESVRLRRFLADFHEFARKQALIGVSLGEAL